MPLARIAVFPSQQNFLCRVGCQGAPIVCARRCLRVLRPRDSQPTKFYWFLSTEQGLSSSGSFPLLTYSLTKAVISEPDTLGETTVEAFVFLYNSGNSRGPLSQLHGPKQCCHPALWVSPPEEGSDHCRCALSTRLIMLISSLDTASSNIIKWFCYAESSTCF